MVEQTFNFITNIMYMIWVIFIAVIFGKRIAYRPEQLVCALIIASAGLLTGVLFMLYFNGPYLLKYFR